MLSRFLFVLLFLISNLSFTQTNQKLIKEGAPNVFINCGYCDLNFIKEQIPVVNYVNDRNDADISVLLTTQSTGAGGTEYSLFFYGQKYFDGVNDTIKFSSEPSEAQDKIRDKTVDALKLGLVKYLSKSPIADQLIITFKKQDESNETIEDDWDFWVFKTSLTGSLSGEERNNFFYLNGSVSANRVTEDLKLKFSVSNSYNESNFKYIDGVQEVKIKSLSRNQSLYASSFFSIDDNWSWGFSSDLYKSTYSNIDLSLRLSPAIEYNFFPYSESNKRQLRIDYEVSPTYNKYISETIFFKTNENLVSQELSATLSLIEEWGSTEFSISGANYFHDMSKYEMELYASISWQLFRGFSLSLYGSFSKIRNQISLEKGEASLDEVLLQRRQLETGYSYYAGFGVSFSFGSIYNNIVNPRFGNSSGGTTIIISD
ncbi:MAG: hypothetical protein IPH11_15065 [Ignavibacteriales bacterium]|nr:hypothetical protein [Ignavibacteriales bacterium]